ncbi:MAG: diguanylate cyclase [Enterocloster asparagiformis]|nr:diguanylate cyclase [Enterocloster asparagiformis]
MSSFVFISITALYFYAFLMLAFLTAKKSKLIGDFIAVLFTMILWTGGSLLMRLQAWPGYRLWYHFSLAGIWLVPYAYFCFIRDFCGKPAKTAHRVWLLLSLAGCLVNLKTGWLLDAPHIVQAGKGIRFVYDMTWRVGIMYGLCLLIVLHTLLLVIRSRKKQGMMSQVLPLLFGEMILFLGNLALPVFNGFPIDILAGVGNAVVMFYTLYTRRMFRLTMLMSQGNCIIIAMGISVVAFYNLAQSLDALIRVEIPMLASSSVMIVAVLTMLATMCIYLVTRGFFDRLFVREEVSQTERLGEYTTQVSRSLRLNEILGALVDVIKDTLNVKKIYICIREADGSYPATYSSSPLDDRNFSMDPGHPMVSWLKSHDTCLLIRDFKRTVEYKSMWEEEKHRLDTMKIEGILPLKDNDDLVGIVLLGRKEKKGKFQRGYSTEDISFLNSLESVSSIAVKNSRLYEKAYMEARTDELTGLLNRKYFYEVLEESYERYSKTSLALVIFNVDDFKLYNELYGNQEGDKALVHIAKIIKGTVGDNGYCARYSGKEFAAILPEFDIYSAQNLAENISRQIQNMNRISTDIYLKTLTVSCGICAVPYAAASLNELVSNADRAVYHVKRSGKNGILVYSDGIIGRRETDEGLDKKHKSMYSEYAPTIYALTAAIDAKDHYTFQHSKNVAYYAEAIAKAIGTGDEYREILKEAALLHDIGKIGIPENILNKEGKLTAEEYDAMKRHVESSVEIIRHLPSMDYVIPAVLGHHERFDGKGYPRRIAGKDIPLAARILCVADSFDAMVSKRCYKPSMSVDFAVGELEKGAGSQFDPELVPIFVEMIKSGEVVPVIDEGLMKE